MQLAFLIKAASSWHPAAWLWVKESSGQAGTATISSTPCACLLQCAEAEPAAAFRSSICRG